MWCQVSFISLPLLISHRGCSDFSMSPFGNYFFCDSFLKILPLTLWPDEEGWAWYRTWVQFRAEGTHGKASPCICSPDPGIYEWGPWLWSQYCYKEEMKSYMKKGTYDFQSKFFMYFCEKYNTTNREIRVSVFVSEGPDMGLGLSWLFTKIARSMRLFLLRSWR